MIDQVTGRGYALIAPDGVFSPYGSGKKSWDILRRPNWPRDDIGFLREVIQDAARRYDIDRDRVLLAGFSNGGTMVWNVACLAPDLARGYAPVAGALWEPMPERCDGPVDLFHVHGWTDRVVPLEGRPLGDGTVVQGDVWKSLGLLRAGRRLREPAARRGQRRGRHLAAQLDRLQGRQPAAQAASRRAHDPGWLGVPGARLVRGAARPRLPRRQRGIGGRSGLLSPGAGLP